MNEAKKLIGCNRRSIEVAGMLLTDVCYGVADACGWWRDPSTGERIERNKGELIALMHSELSECLEGVRKDCADDKLPHRKMEEVELADAVIRIFDYAGGVGLNLGEAIIEKLAFNLDRHDHQPAARAAAGGKKF